MKALAVLHLPVIDVRKEPGDEVTEEELKAAGQTEEDIQRLRDSGGLGDDDDDLHPDYAPVELPARETEFEEDDEYRHLTADDNGKGES